MQDIQQVFDRIQGKKHEQRNIQTQYKDALSASKEYQDTQEKLRGFKLRKKQIEDQVKAELGSQYDQLEALKKDVELDRELLADIAISTLMKGETVSVQDKDKNIYEPIFKVSFKKTNQAEPEKK